MTKDPGPDVIPSGSLDRIFSYSDVEAARRKFTDALEAWPYRIRRVHFGTGLGVPKEGSKSWHVAILVYEKRHLRLAAKLAKKHMPGVPVDIRLEGYAVAL